MLSKIDAKICIEESRFLGRRSAKKGSEHAASWWPGGGTGGLNLLPGGRRFGRKEERKKGRKKGRFQDLNKGEGSKRPDPMGRGFGPERRI